MILRCIAAKSLAIRIIDHGAGRYNISIRGAALKNSETILVRVDNNPQTKYPVFFPELGSANIESVDKAVLERDKARPGISKSDAEGGRPPSDLIAQMRKGKTLVIRFRVASAKGEERTATISLNGLCAALAALKADR